MTTPDLPGTGAQQTPPYAPQQPTLASPTPSAPAPAQPAKAKKPTNIVGLIALIAGVVGFIFACVPGALVIGWILLPVAFIMGLVSLFLKDLSKWMGLTALILSVVGTIVGVVVFLSVVSTSFDDAFSSGDTTVVEPSEDTAAAGEEAAPEESSAVAGTREDPYPIGSTVASDEWSIVINSVTLAANDAVAAANQFNEPPADGSEYILVNYSATYVGDNPDGEMAAFVSVEYVTSDGTTVNGIETLAVAPDAIDTFSTLYTGGTVTGNAAFAVPSATAGEGVLAIRPGMIADKAFVAVQ